MSGHPFILSLALKGAILLLVSIYSALVYANPAISKDGNSIVYALPNPKDSSNWEIWKIHKEDSGKVGAPTSYSKPVLISEKHPLINTIKFNADGTKILVIEKPDLQKKLVVKIFTDKVSTIGSIPITDLFQEKHLSCDWSQDGKTIGIGNGNSFSIFETQSKSLMKSFPKTRFGMWNQAYGSWVLFQESKVTGYYLWHPMIDEPKFLVAIDNVLFPPRWSEQHQAYFQLQSSALPNQRGELDPPLGSVRFGRTHLVQFALGQPAPNSILPLNQFFGQQINTNMYWILPELSRISYIQSQENVPEIIHRHEWQSNRWLTRSWLPHGLLFDKVIYYPQEQLSVVLAKYEKDSQPSLCVLFKHDSALIIPLIHSVERWRRLSQRLIDFSRFSQAVINGNVDAHRKHSDLPLSTKFPIPAKVSSSRFVNELSPLKLEITPEQFLFTFLRWASVLRKSYWNLVDVESRPTTVDAGLLLFFSASLGDKEKSREYLLDIESHPLSKQDEIDFRFADLELQLELKQNSQARLAIFRLATTLDKHQKTLTEKQLKEIEERFSRLSRRLTNRLKQDS